MEMWKSIKNYEGLYKISSLGNVKSCARKGRLKEKILKFWVGTTGYKTVALSKNGKMKKFKIHRLVAFTFLPNQRGLNIINHIDGNKLNNNTGNLEFCTSKYNNLHAYRSGLRKTSLIAIARMNEETSVAVNQYNNDGELLNTFKSLSEASRNTGICLSAISACIVRGRNMAGGYIWRVSKSSTSSFKVTLAK